MSTHPMFSKPHYAAQTLGDQLTGLEGLVDVAAAFPDLPSGVLYVSYVYPDRVMVQLHALAEVEAWRTALDVAADQVCIDQRGYDVSLEFTVSRSGGEFLVWATQAVASLAVSECMPN
ncbi:hypothetical protein [Streptomyces sp. x-80]|uniref:hypothetical protein n=1 Tax=Streptomyces sp. x-80 TaxID=2789282 RepID=UPI00397E96EA